MDFSLPVLMEATVPKGFVVLVFMGVVVMEGFAAMKGFVGLGGLVRTGALLFADPLPLARFAHVLPQYSCTITPSLYLGFLFQCLGGRSAISPPRSEHTHSHHTTNGRESIPCSCSRSHLR